MSAYLLYEALTCHQVGYKQYMSYINFQPLLLQRRNYLLYKRCSSSFNTKSYVYFVDIVSSCPCWVYTFYLENLLKIRACSLYHPLSFHCDHGNAVNARNSLHSRVKEFISWGKIVFFFSFLHHTFYGFLLFLYRNFCFWTFYSCSYLIK